MAVANASAATPPEVRPLAGAAWQLLAGFLDDARPLAKTAAVRSSQKVHAPPHEWPAHVKRSVLHAQHCTCATGELRPACAIF